VALPDMARSLHATFTGLQWVIDIYALILAALLLTVGSIADRIGRRRMYLSGLVLFAAASALSGSSVNAAMLITARGVQGLGAAMMFTTTMALLSNAYQGRDRGVAWGIWGAVGGAAASAGPIIGGLLTAHLGWRWIFFVNLPVSVVAITMSLFVLTESRSSATRRVDLPGMVTFTAAAGCLTYALTRGAWGSGFTLGLLGGAVVALVLFVVAELHRPDPMLDLSLLRNKGFSALLLIGAVMSAAAWSVMTYESVWMQSLLGKSAVIAGLVLFPAAGTAFIVSAAMSRHTQRMSPRLMIGTGMAFVTVGLLAETVIRSGSAPWVVMPGTAVLGIGVGLVVPPLSSTAMALVPQDKAGMAAGTVTTFRQLGYAMGIAVIGEVFSGGLSRVAGSRLAPTLAGGGASQVLARQPGLSHVVHEAFASGLDQSLLVSVGIALVGTLAAFGFLTIPRPPQAPEPSDSGRPEHVVRVNER
jgi:EmrB/QacA subfamily drug resistance transporter